MSGNVLEMLRSDEFALSAGFLSTPGPLRRFLAKSREVAAIRQALKQGAITEETLRRFVAGLMSDLRAGERFAHELPLAALAVALETRATDFAEEFLRDLVSLRLVEMGLCTRVARECLKRRTSLTRSKSRSFEPTRLTQRIPFSVRTSPSNGAGGAVGVAQGTWVCGAK